MIHNLEIDMKWQPIETAPRDLTRIIATDGKYVEVCSYIAGYDMPWRYGSDCEFAMQAILWMPLPEAPMEVK
jgi:hypothetical protein